MLLLAAISCMMVANPGTPDSKKEKKKEKTETVDSVGDSVRRLAGQRNKVQTETG